MKAPSRLLEDLIALTDDNIDIFFAALNDGMQEEWDCPLSVGVKEFGPAELRIAAKSGIEFARTYEIKE
jgi:hypothetical protein